MMKIEEVKKILEEYIKKHNDPISRAIDTILDNNENLEFEIARLKNKIEDIEQDKKDNYKQIDSANQCNVSSKDFI